MKPPAASDDNRWSEGPPLPRWALWLMLPGIVAPILVFGFILVTQAAHDEARCPFREASRRTLAPGVRIVEEQRSCFGSTEERRYTLLRGQASRLLGERRFDRAAFAADRYRWDAVITKEGEVQVKVHSEGHADLLLREGTAEEHEKGISR
jgi:hypothetical protein